MHLPSKSLGTLALACGLLAAAAPAHAVIDTWVSGTGTDASNCPRSAPCRTFAYALTKTNNGGTINVAEPGSFGPVTINKSVSIVADNVEALINTAAGGAAIIVNAAASHVVSLRGLTIQLPPGGGTGVNFTSGSALHVQNCVIRGGSFGVFFSAAATAKIYVSDTVIAQTGGFGFGISALGGTAIRALLNRVRVENAGERGLVFSSNGGSINATVQDSVLTGNTGDGIRAAAGGNTVTLMVDRSASVNNGGAGVSAGGGSIVRVGDSAVTGNVVGLENDAATLESYDTNKVDGNGTDTSGTITDIPYK